MAIVCWGNLGKDAQSTQRIEQAIQDYVESHDENPNAHMGTDYSLGAHRLQTLLDHPYGSIKYYHVYDIHADRITAGGMVVKGAGPYISVQDDEGEERVKIYPEGIIVKNGLISIENDEHQVLIDKKGLWGDNITYIGEVYKTNRQEVIGDFDWYFLTGLEHGIYLSRPSPVQIWGFLSCSQDGNSASAAAIIEYPGGYWPAQHHLWWNGESDTPNWGNIQFTALLHLAGGYNKIRVLGARSTPDSRVWFEGLQDLCSFGYMVLGN